MTGILSSIWSSCCHSGKWSRSSHFQFQFTGLTIKTLRSRFCLSSGGPLLPMRWEHLYWFAQAQLTLGASTTHKKCQSYCCWFGNKNVKVDREGSISDSYTLSMHKQDRFCFCITPGNCCTAVTSPAVTNEKRNTQIWRLLKVLNVCSHRHLTGTWTGGGRICLRTSQRGTSNTFTFAVSSLVISAYCVQMCE